MVSFLYKKILIISFLSYCSNLIRQSLQINFFLYTVLRRTFIMVFYR